LILIINMAAPPTLNLLAEILVITRVVFQNKFNFLLIILVIITGTGYTLIMYSSSIQGSKILSINLKVTNSREILIISNHLIWGFTLILRISLCNF
jgi:NADH:ubiquinone oxidoreductase subunit 4 (subunit M)